MIMQVVKRVIEKDVSSLDSCSDISEHASGDGHVPNVRDNAV